MHEFESHPEVEQAADFGTAVGATAPPSLAQLMVQSSSPAFSLAGPLRRPWAGGDGTAWGSGAQLMTIMSSNGGDASLESFVGNASHEASSSTPRVRGAAREGRSSSSRHSSGTFTAAPSAAAGSSRPSSLLLYGLSRYGPAPVLPLYEDCGRLGGQSSAPPVIGTKALAVRDGLREMITTTSGLVVLAEATAEKGGTEPTRPAGWDCSSAPAAAKEPRRLLLQFPIEGSVAGSAAGPFKDKEPSKRMLVRASCAINVLQSLPLQNPAFANNRICQVEDHFPPVSPQTNVALELPYPGRKERYMCGTTICS